MKGEPRTQRATEPRRGTDCKLCNAKVFGDDEAMVEHYSVVHDRSIDDILYFKLIKNTKS